MGVTLGSTHFREEHRLKVSENSVLGRIFRPKTGEVPGEWKRLHIGKLHKLYPLLTYLLTPWSRVLLENLTGSAAS